MISIQSKKFYMFIMIALLVISIPLLLRIPSIVLIDGITHCSYRYQYFSDTDDSILMNQTVEINDDDFAIIRRLLICPVLVFTDHDFGWTDEHSVLLLDGQNRMIAQVQIAYPWGCGLLRWRGRISGKWLYIRVDSGALEAVLAKYRFGRVLIAG